MQSMMLFVHVFECISLRIPLEKANGEKPQGILKYPLNSYICKNRPNFITRGNFILKYTICHKNGFACRNMTLRFVTTDLPLDFTTKNLRFKI